MAENELPKELEDHLRHLASTDPPEYYRVINEAGIVLRNAPYLGWVQDTERRQVNQRLAGPIQASIDRVRKTSPSDAGEGGKS